MHVQNRRIAAVCSSCWEKKFYTHQAVEQPLISLLHSAQLPGEATFQERELTKRGRSGRVSRLTELKDNSG